MSNTAPAQPVARYLVEFDPKHVSHTFTDLLILGGGIAGLRAALEVGPDQTAIVVTKSVLAQSNSSYAQGGIAGVLDPLDDIASHAADTIAAGKLLCDPNIVQMVVSEAAERIRELVSMGAQFDQIDGRISLTKEGGHSHRRVAHALGDATGKEIMRVMMQAVTDAPQSQIWQKTFTIDLLTHAGQCRGAIVWSERYGKTIIWAKQTILATGGAGRLYRETTNPEIATGDGHALAYRAGAVLRDLEFMQFHPTVLYIAGSSRYLISEAVRGEGAHLLDSHGERFMAQVDPAQELAPRDVVSQAITRQMQKTNHPCVYLDLTHLPADQIRQRFPHISKVCSEFGIDITCERIPVRPGAHYMIGGVSVDDQGGSSLPGLWAAGEASSSGLHGANRLGSNSLLEGLVFGRRCGRWASQLASETPDSLKIWPVSSHPTSPPRDDEELNLEDVRNSLASLMWRNVGIQRTAESLRDAARQVDFWSRYVSARTFSDPAGWELQNMLLLAQLMIRAADRRTESRGVHYRSDFPDLDQQQQRHITCCRPASETA